MNTEQNSNITRREMLARTGAVGAGILASNLILPGTAKAVVPDILRVGLIGCGGRGSGAADQTLSVPNSYVRLVAMGDAYEDRLKSSYEGLKKKHDDKVDVPDDRKFVGLDAYEKVFPHCDVVILATPPGFRPFHFEAAVKAGKHIFMEKPVCVDSFGARHVTEIAKLADEKKLKVVVGLQRHYEASYRAAYEQVKNGILGDILCAQVYWNSGAIWYREPKPEMKTEMQKQVHNWYHHLWLCGDHITEQHVHNLDVANWFLGSPPLEAASGLGGRQVRTPGKPSEIYDHHAIEYRYPGNVVVSSQCRQINGSKGEVREEFHGTKGILNTHPGFAEVTDYKGNTIWKFSGKNENPYQVEHNEFHDAIRNDKPLNNAYYGATSSFTSVLGRLSDYTGEPWKWDDAWKLDYRTMPEKVTWDTNPPVMPDKDGLYPIPTPGEYKPKSV
jgi:predicted dehydrogenase